MAGRRPLRAMLVLAGALLCGLATAAHDAEGVTPVQKVIQLLEGMKAKGDEAKKDEETRFAAFAQWCTDQKRVKTAEISDGDESIEMLRAKIEKDTAEISSLTARIEELDVGISRWERDAKSASDVRNKEATDFTATAKDYGESLEALDEAIELLKEKASKQAQVAALLQVSRLRTLSRTRRQAFEDMARPDMDQSPEAYGYESQSGGVVDMLEQLKDEFEKKKYELDKEETEALDAFVDIAQQLKDNIDGAKHEVEKKTEMRAETSESKASKEGEKKSTESDLAEDKRYLDETTGLCAQKQQDFEARQKLRGEELDAISQATELLASDAVSGSVEKHLPSLLQIRRRSSLAQLRSKTVGAVQAKVAAFLAERAKDCNSRVLALASESVSSNPFEKVKKMIKDLISQLMQESTQEIEHKGWCDTELTTNHQTREQKTEAVEELSAKKEDLTSQIAKLAQDMGDLTSAVAELDAAMAAQAEERTASKEKNEEAVADAKAAQLAVEQATAVLKDFYAKSGEAVAMLQARQSPAEDAPETFDVPYTGLLPEGGNIVSFLEVILSDFARLEAETSSSETAEQDEFEKFTFESKMDKALKENEKEHKAAKQSDSEQALAEAEEELELTQQQLDKAVAYYEKLKPTCVDSGISYEDRVRRREEELQSLREALQILLGQDLS